MTASNLSTTKSIQSPVWRAYRYARGCLIVVVVVVLACLVGADCDDNLSSHCANGDYHDAECRLLAGRQQAHIDSHAGIEIGIIDARGGFQSPGAATINALGLLNPDRSDVLVVRPAGLGEFMLALTNRGTIAISQQVRVQNLHMRQTLQYTLHTPGILDDGAPAAIESLQSQACPQGSQSPDCTWERETITSRRVTVRVPAGQTVWLHSRLDCQIPPRIVTLGDIQRNPTQFQLIVDELPLEVADAAVNGEFLAGVVLLGDLSEQSTQIELRRVEEIMATAPVPFAVLPGNHDVYDEGAPDYTSVFGPGTYGFDLCSARFAIYDTGSGGLAESVFATLQSSLSRESFAATAPRPVHSLAFVHHPPHAPQTDAGWTRGDQAHSFLSEAEIQQVDIIFAGHVHTVAQSEISRIGHGANERSVRQIIAGTGGAHQGWGSPIYGYVRVGLAPDARYDCFHEVPPFGQPRGQCSIAGCKQFVACPELASPDANAPQ